MVGRVVKVKTPILSVGDVWERPKGPFQAGFTLIELLVVLVLAGILAALASVPIARYTATASRQQWVDKVEAFVRGAHDLSIRQMCPVQLTVTPSRLDLSVCHQVRKVLQLPAPYGVVLSAYSMDEGGMVSRQAVNSLWFVPGQALSGGWVDLMDGSRLVKTMDFRSSFAREDGAP
ncbi:MAG: hypothetical protein C0445_00560 [Polaromonas sp.]|nr:hypothetical protein [Polaromonas sp.]